MLRPRARTLAVLAEQGELVLRELPEKPPPVASDDFTMHVVFRPHSREKIADGIPELRPLAVAYCPQIHLMRIAPPKGEDFCTTFAQNSVA